MVVSLVFVTAASTAIARFATYARNHQYLLYAPVHQCRRCMHADAYYDGIARRRVPCDIAPVTRRNTRSSLTHLSTFSAAFA